MFVDDVRIQNKYNVWKKWIMNATSKEQCNISTALIIKLLIAINLIYSLIAVSK